MKRTIATTFLTITTTLVLAHAASAQDTRIIDTRAETIAKGDVAAIMADYAPEPVLHWVGGPLAGDYKGTEAIKGVWTKFTGMMVPLTVKTSGEHEMGTDTLMAETTFTNKAGKTVAVELTELVEDGKIKEETWKVQAPAAVAPTPAKTY